MLGGAILVTLVLSATACSWVQTARAPNSTIVHVLFALRYSNEQQSEDLFQAITNPDSPRYRKFLRPEEVRALVGPHPESQLAVQRYLQERFPQALSSPSSWGHFVNLELTVLEVEAMLNTQCYVYTCGLQKTIKTVDEEFPSFELSQHVAYIGGVTQFPLVRGHPKRFRKAKAEVNETEATFEELRDILQLPQEGASTVFNPVRYFAFDKQVFFSLNIVCPDDLLMIATSTCKDGSSLGSIIIRSAHGSQPQRSKTLDLPKCGYLDSVYTCNFLFTLEDNWVRVAFGFDMVFSGGLTSTYNLQNYIVGSIDKTAEFIKRFYSVPSSLQASNSTSYQAIGALTLGDADSTGFYSPADLVKLYSLFGIPTSNVNLVNFRGDMANDPTRPDVETSLDIQWITALAPGVRSTVWHSPSKAADSIEAIVSQIQQAADRNQAPYVLSFSYGGPEVAMSPSVLQQHESGFRALGLMGITILAASGDTGPYWEVGGCSRFVPVYPASSQYVTSVGATQLVVQTVYNSCKVEESACSVQTGAGITTGGGFSSSIPRPSWQQDAVSEYLRGELPQMAFSSGNRGYPDIAVFGRLYTVYNNLTQETVDGTSAAAPALAGLISLINDVRFNSGLGPVGFLNPALYKMRRDDPESFYDVIAGFNGCTRTACCEQGFYARAGWDPTTGLGSPVFGKFAAALGAGVNGSWRPIDFPDDLDCGVPLIQPNKENAWPSTKWWVVALAIVVAILGVVIIVACWYARQRRRVSPPQLQEGLVTPQI